ncbi:MAG: histidine kinase dimerization/phospho-acceptor domain-containing protein, partial [Aquabacterium sp.]
MSREPAAASGARTAAAPEVDRRRADRRRGDRRQREAPQEESWFGVLGALDDVPSRMAAHPATSPAAADAETTVQPDFLARVAREIVAADETAFARVFKAYAAARAALGLALVLAPWAASLLGSRPDLVLLVIGLAYSAQAVVQWVLPMRGGAGWSIAARRRRQWLGTVGLDMLAFSALHLLEPRSNLNYAALLVLPVLMAGVMSTRIVSLATTSAGALVLLAGVWRAQDGSVDSAVLLTQAGLAGAGLFVISLLAGELAQRLAREERAARGSMALARQQAQLNRLVLEEMPEGVLVIDRRLRLRAANPAAQAMMGLAPRRSALPQPLDADPGWAPLQAAVEEAYAQGAWPDAVRELPLGRSGDEPVRVMVRARFTRRQTSGDDGTPPEDICVLFVEDVRTVQSRQRQDKLAAMGRVSAGIAHEIRNPLAAIAQATALLREDSLAPQQARLADIVADNAERLRRIVDDVIDLAATGA